MTKDEFENLTSVFRPRLVKSAIHKWGDEGEDIVQEAFLRAYEDREMFRSECAFQTWIMGYAKNIAANIYNRDMQPESDCDVMDLVGDDDVVENAAMLEWASRLTKAELAGVLEDTNRMALCRARKKYES